MTTKNRLNQHKGGFKHKQMKNDKLSNKGRIMIRIKMLTMVAPQRGDDLERRKKVIYESLKRGKWQIRVQG